MRVKINYSGAVTDMLNRNIYIFLLKQRNKAVKSILLAEGACLVGCVGAGKVAEQAFNLNERQFGYSFNRFCAFFVIPEADTAHTGINRNMNNRLFAELSGGL